MQWLSRVVSRSIDTAASSATATAADERAVMALQLVSARPDGRAGSLQPRMDGYGNLVIYQSAATDLIADDTNGAEDIFMTDTRSWVTQRVSLDESGKESLYGAANPALDALGDTLFYDRQDETGRWQIYRYRALTRTTGRFSDPAGDAVLFDNSHPAVSSDSRYVAYLQSSPEGVPGECRVYLSDLQTLDYDLLGCPAALQGGATGMAPLFSDDNGQIEWNPGSDAPPVTTSNTLLRE